MDIVRPESVGLDAGRLARIGALTRRYVDQGKLAGAVTLVARRGEIAHFEATGQMDIARGTPMARDTLLRIYSMTKPITSVAVMMLQEQGRLRLTDPVADLVPAFADAQVWTGGEGAEMALAPLARPITIHDLLTHTAGLSYGFEEHPIDALYRERLWKRADDDAGYTLAEAVAVVAGIPLFFQPGTAWRYSFATDVLGYVVQVVSGVPFETYLQDQILGPLGMVDTAFHVPAGKIDRFATNYGPAKEGAGIVVVDDPATSHYLQPPSSPSGGGGLISTTIDYWRFAQMLLNGGELEGVRLLGRKTVELMRMDHLPAGGERSGDPGHGFGLGFGVTRDLAAHKRQGSPGAYGWGGAASTRFWIDPQEDLIGIWMTQFMPNNHYPVADEFEIAVYQAIVD
ncbi:MAG: beta-lactamase family protein [Anaerolineae bacterium]|nr:beta-lactamase family protein [Anaerolineae bacterium]